MMFENSDDDEMDMLMPVLMPRSPKSTKENIEEKTSMKAEAKEADEEITVDIKMTVANPNFITSSSFLVREKNPTHHMDTVEQTLVRAECSEEVKKEIKEKGLGMHHLDGCEISNSGDAARLESVLDKDSLIPWDSSSLYNGLGIDEDGNVSSISLIRFCDLLTNINGQLLIMEKELKRHEIKIKESKQNGTSRLLGFEDQNNIGLLRRMCSLMESSTRKLAERIEGLEEIIVKKSEHDGKHGYSKGKIVLGILMFVGVAYVAGAIIRKT